MGALAKSREREMCFGLRACCLKAPGRFKVSYKLCMWSLKMYSSSKFTLSGSCGQWGIFSVFVIYLYYTTVFVTNQLRYYFTWHKFVLLFVFCNFVYCLQVCHEFKVNLCFLCFIYTSSDGNMVIYGNKGTCQDMFEDSVTK